MTVRVLLYPLEIKFQQEHTDTRPIGNLCVCGGCTIVLEEGVRRRIHACVINKIRDTFPEPSNVYVGFNERGVK